MTRSFRVYRNNKLIADVICYDNSFKLEYVPGSKLKVVELKEIELKEISDKLIADLDKIDYLANLQKEE